jgi:chromosome segregation ATPase
VQTSDIRVMGDRFTRLKPTAATTRMYVLHQSMVWLRSCIVAGRVLDIPLEQEFQSQCVNTAPSSSGSTKSQEMCTTSKVVGVKRRLDTMRTGRKVALCTNQSDTDDANKYHSKEEEGENDEEKTEMEDDEEEAEGTAVTAPGLKVTQTSSKKTRRNHSIESAENVEKLDDSLLLHEMNIKYRKKKKALHRLQRKYDEVRDVIDQYQIDVQHLKIEIVNLIKNTQTTVENYETSKSGLKEKLENANAELEQKEALAQKAQFEVKTLQMQREIESKTLAAVQKELVMTNKKFESVPSVEAVESALRKAANAHHEIQNLKCEHARELAAAQHDVEIMSGNAAWSSTTSAAAAESSEGRNPVNESSQGYHCRVAYKASSGK